MNNAANPICVDRILVSLDTSKHSFAALKAAIELGRHYDAELKGVFIEDITLLSLAEMGFRQEVGEYSATVRDISKDGMTRAIFVQSRWIIRTFQKMINQTNLTGDFAILRGKVSETIERESEQCDLLILGKSGTNPLHSRHLGSTAKAIIRNQKKPLLLVEEDNILGHPMILLYHESSLGQIALESAADLLAPGETLVILLDKEDHKSFINHKQAISEWASKKKINITYQTYTNRSFDRFLQGIQGIKTGLFILPHIQELQDRRIAELVLENVSLPILLIRAGKVSTAKNL